MLARFLVLISALAWAACVAPASPPGPTGAAQPAPPAHPSARVTRDGPAAPTTPTTSGAPSKSPTSNTSAASQRQGASSWKTNEAGIALIKASEGLRLTAYSTGGKWLIGYGHTDGVREGMTITAAQADAFLREDMKLCESAVAGAVIVPVTQNEFSAMVSLCFNIGGQRFGKSSVVTRLNSGDRAGAADAFLNWVKAGGNPAPHLVKRREAERALFLT